MDIQLHDSHQLQQIAYKDVNAIVRVGTSDEFVVKEVLSGEYRKLHIGSDDVIVDFGTNIGMFCIYASKQGAKHVYGFEPERDNFTIANANVTLNGIFNVTIANAAVVGNDDTERSFSINVKKNKGAHSLVTKRGRDTIEVKCQNINEILQTLKPTIVKMDTEGAEYECLRAMTSFAGIKEFIMEFHHAHLLDKNQSKFKEIVGLMQQHFKNVEFRKDPKGAWVSIIYGSNIE